MKNLFIPLLSIIFLIASCGSNPTPQGDTSKPEGSSGIESSSLSISSESTSKRKEYSSNPMKDPYISRQYYLNHIGDIYTSWKYYRGEGQTIAVIDEGFKGNHEDFAFEDGSSKVSPKSASFTYNNGKVTTKVGINYVDADEASHGTFCAGVASAGINGKGVVGIAPNAKLLLLKTDLKPKSIAEAFHYAADNGATVITISIGSYENYEGDLLNDGSNLKTVFNEPVKYCYDKNIPVISAGGNGASSKKTYPGSVEYVIGVGGLAANSSSEAWSDTTYNASKSDRHIDVMAPSDMMFGCSNYKRDGKEIVYDGGWKGTSFASPQVAGMAALYFEKYPTATAKQFEEALYASCHKIDNNGKYGYGRVDVGKLLDINNTDEVTIRIKANWSSVYVYAWNLDKNKELKAWPGNKLTKSNNEYTITIEPNDYDSIVINDGGNNKSPDIYVSSFIYEKAYSLTSSTKENDYLIGRYS
ncbi:MAG: starch-binding protein [Erysipelotrichaceae bacterium]|nr:starch-binding protein [Erysipelotrichaceae bacterium]